MTDEKVEIRGQGFAPLADAKGAPRSRIAPYLPVLQACNLCQARCCRLNVKVCLPDAVHYCATLGVPFFAGLTMVPSEDPEHAFQLDEGPRFRQEGKPWPGTAEIQLRRREDGGCTSLIRVGEHERCGVYGARPAFCRTYPAAWTAETMQGGPAAIVCPVPYGIDPAHEAELVQDIQRSIRFWGLHDRIVAEWNQMSTSRSVQEFLQFAIPRTCEALDMEAGLTLARGDRERRLYQAMLDAKVIPPPRIPVLNLPEPSFADLEQL